MRNFIFLFVTGCFFSCATANIAVPRQDVVVSASTDCSNWTLPDTLILINGAGMNFVWISLLVELEEYISQLPDHDELGSPTIIKVVVMFGGRPLSLACGTTSAVAVVLRQMIVDDNHDHLSRDGGYALPATDLGPVAENILCRGRVCAGELVYIFHTNITYKKEYWGVGSNPRPTTNLLDNNIKTSIMEICPMLEEPAGQWLGVEGAIRYKPFYYERKKDGEVWIGPDLKEWL